MDIEESADPGGGSRSERHGRLGAGSIFLDRIAEAAIIEQLERGTVEIEYFDAR